MLKYIRHLSKFGSRVSERSNRCILVLTSELNSQGNSKTSFTCGNRRSISTSTAKWRNLYSVLQVSPNANQEEIKKAYYKLSFKYHPDRNKDSKSTSEQFQEISDAYAILSDVEARTKYDRGLVDVGHATMGTASTKKTRKSEVVGYNFDEWHKQHYREARLRKQRSIQESKLYEKESFIQQEKDHIDNESNKFKVASLIVFVLVISFYFMEREENDGTIALEKHNDAQQRKTVMPKDGSK